METCVLRIVVIGVGVAAPVVFVCGKLIGGTLFGASTTDPVAVAIAGFLPARKASRLDPMAALRCE